MRASEGEGRETVEIDRGNMVTVVEGCDTVSGGAAGA